MCDTWCPENDGAYRDELATIHKSRVEENFNSLQLLKAEIAEVLNYARENRHYSGEITYTLDECEYEKLQKLSAVQ